MNETSSTEQKLATIYEFLHKYLLARFKAGDFKGKTFISAKAQ